MIKKDKRKRFVCDYCKEEVYNIPKHINGCKICKTCYIIEHPKHFKKPFISKGGKNDAIRNN